MLKIYICPKCYNFRMVSRKPDAVCFHCGSSLEKCELEYAEFIGMSELERNRYRDNYKKRICEYGDRMEAMLREQPIVK